MGPAPSLPRAAGRLKENYGNGVEGAKAGATSQPSVLFLILDHLPPKSPGAGANRASDSKKRECFPPVGRPGQTSRPRMGGHRVSALAQSWRPRTTAPAQDPSRHDGCIQRCTNRSRGLAGPGVSVRRTRPGSWSPVSKETQLPWDRCRGFSSCPGLSLSWRRDLS